MGKHNDIFITCEMDDGSTETHSLTEWGVKLDVPTSSIYTRWYKTNRGERDYTNREIVGLDKLQITRLIKTKPKGVNQAMKTFSSRRLIRGNTGR